MNEVADRIEQVTPAWMTAVLERELPGIVVDDLAVEQIGTGQIGANYRTIPTYRTPIPGAPATVVVKLAAGDPAARQRVSGGFRKEVGFYRELAATVAVRTPRCWHAAISDDASEFTLVLEDLAPAVPGVQAHGCTVAEASAALTNLAALHGPRWDDRELYALEFLTPADASAAAFLGEVFRLANEQFVARYRDELGEAEVATLGEVAEVLGEWQLSRPEPFAVVHGDYRLDNLMFGIAGGGVAALDWQTVTVAPPGRDLAYFLGNSLDTELRRASEEGLVTGYVAALAEHGVRRGADDCFEDYRLGQLQGPMITVLGCIYATATRSEASDAMFLAMARRSCAAIRDLRSLELL